MSSFTGIASAAAQIGLQTVLIQHRRRGLFSPKLADGSVLEDVVAQATIEEQHTDELEITDHPIQQGAVITDHAFKRPAELVLKLGWSNSPTDSGGLINAAIGVASAANSTVGQLANLAEQAYAVGALLRGSQEDQVYAIYQKLLKLQESRALFDILTGKRAYQNMICKSLAVETDFRSENALFVTMKCRQLILVNAKIISLPKDLQKGATAPATTSTAANGSIALVKK